MAEGEQEIWEIIEQVLNGNSTEYTNRLLEDWMNSSNENRKAFEALKKIGFKYPSNFQEIKSNSFAKLQSRIIEEKTQRKLIIWRYSAVASIAILIACTFFGLFFYKSDSFNKVPIIETKIPFGQKSKITLPDGTIVLLNSGSYLKYPVQFTGGQRKLFLKGEAYFEVTKDAKHPFIVETDLINIKVFGTHFNVKSYPEDNLFETILVEGSVGIYKSMNDNEKDIVRLLPNQKATYNRRTNKIDLINANAELAVTWKEGNHYFENATLATITKELERSFNVPIVINSSELQNTAFFGLFDKKKSVYQILDGIAKYGNFSYKLRNDTIVIQK